MKKFLAMSLALIMVLSLFAGCGGAKEEAAAPAGDAPAASGGAAAPAAGAPSRDEVIVRCEQVWYNLHPLEGIVGFPNLYILDQAYEALTRIDDAGVVQPRLATEWTISEDAKEFTFKIREGVKFHNGEELKASDVVFTYEVAMETASCDIYLNKVTAVEALDDYTVKITLGSPSVSFLNNTAEIYIFSEKYYNEVGGDMLEQGCGTGPYMIKEVDLSTEIKLEAFEEYWECDVPIKYATVRAVTDSTTAAMSFENGELDYMQVSNISAYAPLADSGNFNTELVTTLHTAYIALNNEVAPFDNKLVRQALNYCMDRESMVAIAYEGLAEPAYLMADERAKGVDLTAAKEYTYDLEKAKALLAEAGYPDGINFTEDFGITFDIIAGGYFEKFAQVFQQSLAEIGCVIELRASETYSSDAATGNYAIVTQGMTFTYDFAYNEGLYGTSGINSKNHARFSDERVDELFAMADATTVEADRATYYKEICDILADECPTLPVLHRQIPYAWAKELNAVPHNAVNHPYYIYEWSWN